MPLNNGIPTAGKTACLNIFVCSFQLMRLYILKTLYKESEGTLP
jgi:hypothetical protein